MNKHCRHKNKFAAAKIKGSCKYPNICGTVTFRQGECAVIVTADIGGLPRESDECDRKIFAFHIHSGTSCTGNKDDCFADAGLHFNPCDCEHPSHAGDLPPLFGNNGCAYMQTVTNKFTVDDIIGKTVVVHAMPDDFKTQPSGNSGEKIACGVIKCSL